MVFPKLPDPYPNAIRVALAVFTATAIGYGIVLPEHGEHRRLGAPDSKEYGISCCHSPSMMTEMALQVCTLLTQGNSHRHQNGLPSHVLS